jgi:hypothetical protein
VVEVVEVVKVRLVLTSRVSALDCLNRNPEANSSRFDVGKDKSKDERVWIEERVPDEVGMRV